MPELAPKKEIRLPTGLRCPSTTCKDRVRRFEPISGIQADFLNGRYVHVRCRTCGFHALVGA